MDENIRRKNIFLTDKIARKALCLGGLFYPMSNFQKIISLLVKLVPENFKFYHGIFA